MIARIADNNFVYLDNLTTFEEAVVRKRFTVEVNNRFIDSSQHGGWNGIFCRYNSTHQRLARPYLNELKALCDDKKLPLVIKDEREPWACRMLAAEEIGPDFLPGITLEQYQVDAIRTALVEETGIIDIKPGGGKTEVAAGICKAIQCPTVILADQRIVIDQIKQRLELRDVVDEVGLFYAGRTPTGQTIIVGSIQSTVIPTKIPDPPLRRRSIVKAKKAFIKLGDKAPTDHTVAAELLKAMIDAEHKKALKRYAALLKGLKKRKKRAQLFRDIIKKAEMIIVDECDMAASNPYRSVFRHLFSGRRRYGLSGTPFDDERPVNKLIIQEHFGSIIVNVSKDELERLNRIVPLLITVFAIGDTPNEGSAYDIAVNDRIVNGADFHNVVTAICATHRDDGTLILVERDDLGHKLAGMIGGSIFIHGKTPKRRRDEVLRSFERRDVNVVIGGKILRRGMDLRGGCENLVIGTGGKLWSTFYQQISRAVRVNSQGYGRVYDFLFLNNKYLYAHSRARLKAMVNLGYKVKVVFQNGQVVDGHNFVNSRFRRPK